MSASAGLLAQFQTALSPSLAVAGRAWVRLRHALAADDSTRHPERWVPAAAPLLGCLGFVLAIRVPALGYLPLGALLVAGASAVAAWHWGIHPFKLAARSAVALVGSALLWWVVVWSMNRVSVQEQTDVLWSAVIAASVVLAVTGIALVSLSMMGPAPVPPVRPSVD